MIKFLPLIFILLWSSAFITTKPIVDYSDPFAALSFRFLIVAIGFYFFSLFSKHKILVHSKNILPSISTGVLFHGFYLGGVFYSISIGLPTGIAALIVTLQPVLTNALAGPVLNEKVTLNKWLGVLLGFIGAALVIIGSGIWAFGQVLVKPLSKEINPLALVAWLALFSGPILIALSAIFDGNTIIYFKTASLDSWIIAIYLGFIMQPISYGCFYYVLKNNPLYKVLPIVTMGIPLTGLLAAIFILGEEPTRELFIGGTIILLGVVMIVFGNKKN